VSRETQLDLFDVGHEEPAACQASSTTFIDNMRLPVHRWFRYSAGFSAEWARSVIADFASRRPTRVLDPFAGSGTTLIVAEDLGAESYGVEAHPFIFRIAKAKLLRRSDPEAYREFASGVYRAAKRHKPEIDAYPVLIRKCYEDEALCGLDQLRRAYEERADDSDASTLTWLTLVGILRRVSHVGTAQWQYVLPKKSKKGRLDPFVAFRQQMDMISHDMCLSSRLKGPPARIIESDARTCDAVPSGFATLVVTSPPYPNNYDYADATRLEMTFVREIDGWSDLQRAVRRFLVRSCSQHVPERSIELDRVLMSPELEPIRSEISAVCGQLAEVRKTKGGKKTYHLMVACYFLDMAQTWRALRRVCDSACDVCFVLGDSAPYGVYVPVIDWMGRIAVCAGFKGFRFERTRDRNVKWKNRKHRVPLCEGRLWVEG
jgi:hypothetical protein